MQEVTFGLMKTNNAHFIKPDNRRKLVSCKSVVLFHMLFLLTSAVFVFITTKHFYRLQFIACKVMHEQRLGFFDNVGLEVTCNLHPDGQKGFTFGCIDQNQPQGDYDGDLPLHARSWVWHIIVGRTVNKQSTYRPRESISGTLEYESATLATMRW
jgi:hypothetical protein